MKRLLWFPVFAGFMFAALPALAQQDVSGVWKIDGSVSDNPVAATCTLKQVDTHITGSCKMDQDPDKALDVKGEVTDKQVTWKYDLDYEGTVYTLSYTGSLDSATSIKGTIAVTPSDSEGDFIATKQ